MVRTKLLQIIHISDLHVGADGVSAETALVRKTSRIALWLTRLMTRGDVFNWNEGTQTHFPAAPEMFEAFLEHQRSIDTEWFSKDIPTWLVDTGDLTTFGDSNSIRAGKQYLERWARAAGATHTRSLYGNHDAWPSCMPLVKALTYKASLAAQKKRLTAFPEWQPESWCSQPLSVDIAGGTGRIDLYALDSVDWAGYRNGRAVGHIPPEPVHALRARIEQGYEPSVPCLRIVATHHPIAFPYEKGEVRPLIAPFPDAMHLANSEEVARSLSNSARQPLKDPYVHIILSGHTHARYPGGKFSLGVTEVYQGNNLDRYQLQLVAGSLMLNRSVKEVATSTATSAEPLQMNRSCKGFAPAVLNFHPCQADLLRFSMVSAPMPGEQWHLKLERIPIVCAMGTEYILLQGEAQQIDLYVG